MPNLSDFPSAYISKMGMEMEMAVQCAGGALHIIKRPRSLPPSLVAFEISKALGETYLLGRWASRICLVFFFHIRKNWARKAFETTESSINCQIVHCKKSSHLMADHELTVPKVCSGMQLWHLALITSASWLNALAYVDSANQSCNRRNEQGEITFDTSAFSIAAGRAPHDCVTKSRITFLEDLIWW